MKFIGHLNAAAAWREPIEEFTPERAPFLPDLIEAIRSAYSFQNYPNLEAMQPAPSGLLFSVGQFKDADEPFGILTLAMEAEADIVMTVTTDQADQVLDDLIRRLDQFGYRLGTANKTKSYVSNIAVEFDFPLEEYIGVLAKIASVINATRPDMPKFNLKRLAFGEPTMRAPTDQISNLEATDFLIERRVGRPFEQNRYYCSAPMRTVDHIRVLTEIEAIVRDGAK